MKEISACMALRFHKSIPRHDRRTIQHGFMLETPAATEQHGAPSVLSVAPFNLIREEKEAR
jgi:hypothetical protein